MKMNAFIDPPDLKCMSIKPGKIIYTNSPRLHGAIEHALLSSTVPIKSLA